jgi:hypothetical protein
VNTCSTSLPRSTLRFDTYNYSLFLDISGIFGIYKAQTGFCPASGLLGNEPYGLGDLNARLQQWVYEVANPRVHATTHEQPIARWETERLHLHALADRPPYPYIDDELRTVARDAYVKWQGS